MKRNRVVELAPQELQVRTREVQFATLQRQARRREEESKRVRARETHAKWQCPFCGIQWRVTRPGLSLEAREFLEDAALRVRFAVRGR